MTRPPHRGFASMMAVISLMLVGITIATMMLRLSNESRRTEAEMKRAQRDQTTIARSIGKTGGNITLPSQ